MDRFIVKPTSIIDKRGIKHTAEDLMCDGTYSDGSSSGTSNCECDSKRYQFNVYTILNQGYAYRLQKTTQSDSVKTLGSCISITNNTNDYIEDVVNNHATRITDINTRLNNVGNIVDEYTGYTSTLNSDVYKLQQNDKKQDTNIETAKTTASDAKTTADEAKTTANAAHSIASGLQEAVGNAESTAVKAQEKALEAYNSLHSLNTDYENLKSRVEDLEETGGQASVPVVGNSKMGYASDFTEYGQNGKYYIQATWNGESRSLQFDSESKLGDVVEELMYVTASGITEMHNRVTALENNSGGSSGTTTHGDCLEQQITFKPASQMSKEAVELITGETLTDEQYEAFKQQESSQSAKDLLEDCGEMMGAMLAETMLNKSKITSLEQQGGGSFEYQVPEFGCANDMYGNKDYTQQGAIIATTIPQALDAIQNNVNVNQEIISDHISKIKTINNNVTLLQNQQTTNTTKIGTHTTDIAAIQNRLTDVETLASGNKSKIESLQGGSPTCNCASKWTTHETEFNLLRTDCQSLSDYTTSNVQNLHDRINSLKTAILNDLDYIWTELRSIHNSLPEISKDPNSMTSWNVASV